MLLSTPIISANMATFPLRKNYVEKTVRSILPQVHVLRVYLNEYKKIPSFLLHPKIVTVIGKEDVGDAGKFFWCGEQEEIYFTIDDDLLYAPHYVREHLRTLAHYQFKVLVTLHGYVLAPDAKDYRNDRKGICGYYEHSNEDKYGNVGGTGVMAFHTAVMPFKFSDLKHPNMADIWVAKKAQEYKIPIVVRKHTAEEAIAHAGIPNRQTIWGGYKKNNRPDIEVGKLTWAVHMPRQQKKSLAHKELLQIYSHPRSGTHLAMNLFGQNLYPNSDLGKSLTEWGHWKSRKKEAIHNPYAKLFGSHDFPQRANPGNKVYVYRDGRSTLVSMWKFLNPGVPFSDFLKPKIDFHGSPAWKKKSRLNIVEHWYIHVWAWHVATPPDTILVRYEDLVRKPEKIVRAVSQKFDLPMDRGFLPVTQKVGIQPNEGEIYTWKKHFSPEDLEWFFKFVPRDCPYLTGSETLL